MPELDARRRGDGARSSPRDGTARSRPTPVALRRGELGLPILQPERIRDAGAARGDRRPSTRPRGPRGLRPDRAVGDPRPAAARHPERPSVAAAAPPRRDADPGGDRGRRRSDGRLDHPDGRRHRHRPDRRPGGAGRSTATRRAPSSRRPRAAVAPSCWRATIPAWLADAIAAPCRRTTPARRRRGRSGARTAAWIPRGRPSSSSDRSGRTSRGRGRSSRPPTGVSSSSVASVGAGRRRGRARSPPDGLGDRRRGPSVRPRSSPPAASRCPGRRSSGVAPASSAAR